MLIFLLDITGQRISSTTSFGAVVVSSIHFLLQLQIRTKGPCKGSPEVNNDIRGNYKDVGLDALNY